MAKINMDGRNYEITLFNVNDRLPNESEASGSKGVLVGFHKNENSMLGEGRIVVFSFHKKSWAFMPKPVGLGLYQCEDCTDWVDYWGIMPHADAE